MCYINHRSYIIALPKSKAIFPSPASEMSELTARKSGIVK